MNDTKSARRKNTILQTLVGAATHGMCARRESRQRDGFVSCQYDNLMRDAVVTGPRSNPQFF